MCVHVAAHKLRKPTGTCAHVEPSGLCEHRFTHSHRHVRPNVPNVLFECEIKDTAQQLFRIYINSPSQTNTHTMISDGKHNERKKTNNHIRHTRIANTFMNRVAMSLQVVGNANEATIEPGSSRTKTPMVCIIRCSDIYIFLQSKPRQLTCEIRRTYACVCVFSHVGV